MTAPPRPNPALAPHRLLTFEPGYHCSCGHAAATAADFENHVVTSDAPKLSPVTALAGAVPLPPCGGCDKPVCACTMHRGGCVGNGYVHVATRKHACGQWSGRASCAWPAYPLYPPLALAVAR